MPEYWNVWKITIGRVCHLFHEFKIEHFSSETFWINYTSIKIFKNLKMAFPKGKKIQIVTWTPSPNFLNIVLLSSSPFYNSVVFQGKAPGLQNYLHNSLFYHFTLYNATLLTNSYLSPFYTPDLVRRVDSPALSGRGSRPSGRTSGWGRSHEVIQTRPRGWFHIP